MKILENHFNDNNTIIVGDYINNGCQTFHIDKAKEVFEKFKVPLEMQKETLEAYAENKKSEEDWNQLISNEDYNVRVLVAYNKKCLDILVNDKEPIVRIAVAQQGFGLEKLINVPICM